MGAQLGDLGVVLYKNGKVVPVVYGDRGPALKLGEGAMGVARALSELILTPTEAESTPAKSRPVLFISFFRAQPTHLTK